MTNQFIYVSRLITLITLTGILFPACAVFLSKERLALLYQRQGRKKMEKKHYRMAEWYLEKSYALAPRNPVVKQLLPQVYVKRRKMSKAADYAERFAVIQDDTVRAPEICYNLGLFLLYNGAMEGQNANAFLEKAARHLKRAMRLDSMRCQPGFSFQAECNAALCVLNVLYASHAYNPAFEKQDRLHKKILACELELARGFAINALRYDPKHESTRRNLDAIDRALGLLGQKPQAPDLTPFARKPLGVSAAPVDSAGIPAPVSREDSMFSNPLRVLGVAMLDSLNAYDELILVLDISGSMVATMFPGRVGSRMEMMRNIALALADGLKPSVKLGCITIGGHCNALPRINLTTRTPRKDLRKAIESVQVEGATPLHRVMKSTPDLFADGRKPSAKRRGICVLSDGLNSCPDPDMICQIAQDLAALNIQTNVVSLLLLDASRNQVEYEAYQCMSAFGGGVLVAATASGRFKEISSPRQFDPFDVVLPEMKPDQCCAVTNLVMMPASAIRAAFRLNPDMLKIEDVTAVQDATQQP